MVHRLNLLLARVNTSAARASLHRWGRLGMDFEEVPPLSRFTEVFAYVSVLSVCCGWSTSACLSPVPNVGLPSRPASKWTTSRKLYSHAFANAPATNSHCIPVGCCFFIPEAGHQCHRYLYRYLYQYLYHYLYQYQCLHRYLFPLYQVLG